MRARRLKLHPMTAKKLLRLKREADGDGAYRVAKRIHAVLLNHDGYTSGRITTLLKAPRSRVSEWLKNYERYGYEGLLEGYRSGRPREMTAKDEQSLADIIESGPVAYGFLSGVWTSPMIAETTSTAAIRCSNRPHLFWSRRETVIVTIARVSRSASSVTLCRGSIDKTAERTETTA